MSSFKESFPSIANSSSAQGWLTSVLQLGGILGSLTAGVFGEVFSRKYTMFSACCWVVLGSYLYVGASHHDASLLYAGRFFTGVGVGSASSWYVARSPEWGGLNRGADEGVHQLGPGRVLRRQQDR